jgi:DNA-binding NarL/FixJ family response regulator
VQRGLETSERSASFYASSPDASPREAEVLKLVARGHTNREIAAAPVISVKTASVHVSHILRKLGAPNRLEAAAIAHRLTLPND